MRTVHPPYTDVYELQQMAEAGEVTQRVLIKDNAPRYSNRQGGLTLSKPSLLLIWRQGERLLIFLMMEVFSCKLRLIISAKNF